MALSTAPAGCDSRWGTGHGSHTSTPPSPLAVTTKPLAGSRQDVLGGANRGNSVEPTGATRSSSEGTGSCAVALQGGRDGASTHKRKGSSVLGHSRGA
jgi:hypothetical protein